MFVRFYKRYERKERLYHHNMFWIRSHTRPFCLYHNHLLFASYLYQRLSNNHIPANVYEFHLQLHYLGYLHRLKDQLQKNIGLSRYHLSAEALAINDITVEEMTAIAAIRFTIFFTTNFLSAQNELSVTALCCQNLVFISVLISADCLLCVTEKILVYKPCNITLITVRFVNQNNITSSVSASEVLLPDDSQIVKLYLQLFLLHSFRLLLIIQLFLFSCVSNPPFFNVILSS